MSTNAMAPDSELTVRPFAAEDQGEVLDLLTASLGPGPTGTRSPEVWRWKHLDNAFGPSLILVAEADGRIVGLRAFMRWRFRLGQRLIQAVRAVDTATHPNWHRRGVFSTTTLRALEVVRDDAHFVFNTPNGRSGSGYLKMGWRSVGRIPLSVMVRSPKGLISVLRSGGRSKGSFVGGQPAAEALADDQAVGDLLHQVEVPLDRLTTDRSVAYLRWRYEQPPALDYRAITEGEGSTLDGMAIFRLRRRGRLRETMLSELLVRSGDSATARRLVRSVARAADSDHIVAVNLPLGTWGGVRSGLVRWRGPLLMVNRLQKGLEADPATRRSWRLSAGDLEVF
jgi:hypothetical protein